MRKRRTYACPSGFTDDTAAPYAAALRTAGYAESPHEHSSLGALGRAHLDAAQRYDLTLAVEIHDREWLVVTGMAGRVS